MQSQICCFNSSLLSCQSCLRHVINLAEIDIISHITEIAAVETTTAIWEYDPQLLANHMLGRSLDVIATFAPLLSRSVFSINYCWLILISPISSCLGSALSTSKGCRSSVGSLSCSIFPFTAMFNGAQCIGCSTASLSFDSPLITSLHLQMRDLGIS